VTDSDRDTGYQPLTLLRLAGLLASSDDSHRWRLIAEFLEEYRWEPASTRSRLLEDEPETTGDEHWDVFLEDARAVAKELELPAWWLNEQASVYVAPGGDSAAPRVFDHPGLRVSAASPDASARDEGICRSSS
jgi:hypothetical protein